MYYIISATVILLAGVFSSRRTLLAAFSKLETDTRKHAYTVFQASQKKQIIPLLVLLGGAFAAFYFLKEQSTLFSGMFLGLLILYLFYSSFSLYNDFRNASIPTTFIKLFIYSRLLQAGGYAGFILLFGIYYFQEMPLQ